jgi:hypothetical protein
LLPAGAVAGWDLHPLESAAFPRRTPGADVTYWIGQPLSGARRGLAELLAIFDGERLRCNVGIPDLTTMEAPSGRC